MATSTDSLVRGDSISPAAPSTALTAYSASTTRETSCHRASSRWWTCPSSASAGDRPERLRRMTAQAVSARGTPRLSTGATSAMAAGPLAPPRAVAAAKAKPRARAPLSPMKIRAGGKLYPRKATHPAASTASSAAASCTPTAAAASRVGTAAMAATPAASPSSPSRRLTALLTPTSHSTVTGTDQGPRWAMREEPPSRDGTEIQSMRRPSPTETAAPASWPRSLAWGDSPRRSSTRPTTKTTAVPPSTASRGWRGRPLRARRDHPTSQPAISATPPSRGTGRR